MFIKEKFISHSGLELPFKIECDSLTDAYWECLAYMGSLLVGPFSKAVSISRGGDKLATHLTPYAKSGIIPPVGVIHGVCVWLWFPWA